MWGLYLNSTVSLTIQLLLFERNSGSYRSHSVSLSCNCNASIWHLTESDSNILRLWWHPLPPLRHIADVTLVRRKRNINWTVVQYCVRCNGAQWYEQFLHIIWLDQTLILLVLACYLPVISVSSIFMVLQGPIYGFFKKMLHSLLNLLVNSAWWDWPLTWLTNHTS